MLSEAATTSIIAAVSALTGVVLSQLLNRFTQLRAQEAETRRLRREATARLVVALNHVYDETRATPTADHEVLWGDVYERFIEMSLLFPLDSWRAGRGSRDVSDPDRGVLRKHLDVAWAWRDRCARLHPGEPVPPAPPHEALLEDVLPLLKP